SLREWPPPAYRARGGSTHGYGSGDFPGNGLLHGFAQAVEDSAGAICRERRSEFAHEAFEKWRMGLVFRPGLLPAASLMLGIVAGCNKARQECVPQKFG